MKNIPSEATHFIKKPFRKIRYLHRGDGCYWFLNKNNQPTDMCRDWIFWIKPIGDLK